MNAAEILLRKVFGFGEQAGDVFADPGAYIHPDARTSLFGPSGGKEAMIGRDAFVDFARRCEEALSGRSDEIIAITGIDEECALVHARAWRICFDHSIPCHMLTRSPRISLELLAGSLVSNWVSLTAAAADW